MTDQDLIQHAERVHEKLLAIRANLYDIAQGKEEGSPEHTAWHNACVAMRQQGEVVDELKRRLVLPAAPAPA